jgi:tetratricopeptide (TPR) repeat protein
MDQGADAARRALAAFRSGDFRTARAAGEAALAAGSADAALLHLLGAACARAGDLAAGIGHLRRAAALDPASGRVRIDLVQALIAAGELDEAERLAAVPSGDPRRDAEIARHLGYAFQVGDRPAAAAAAYERAVALAPDDFQAWNNLGNARRESGDVDGAVEALARACALRPDLAVLHLNLGALLAAAGRLEDSLGAIAAAVSAAPDDPACLVELSRALGRLGRSEKALDPAMEAARLAPGEPAVQAELGFAHAAVGNLGAAEQAYRRALAVQPAFPAALLGLGLLLESSNRGEELAALLEAAAAASASGEDTALLSAFALRRQGRLEEALAAATAAPESIEPSRRAQLIGELADRLGDSRAAFAAFAEMNRTAAAAPTAPRLGAEQYRREVEAAAALTTPQWVSGWSAAGPDETRPAPAFLVGFPRSGTTLLDTVLMGHDRVHVVEEQPMLRHVLDALGGLERLADLSADALSDLRARYFAELDRIAPPPPGKLVIDKMPLNIMLAPLAHRIFPDARFVFALRHPCDVVLSCFMTNFGLNYATANFLDLGDSARLYDLVMRYWQSCGELLPLRMREVRYEAMVEDLEAEIRPLLAFLDLPWDESILDYRRTASDRGYISTASYAQVTERLYARAQGRWRRYREEMRDVLPILAPWAERLGYGSLDADG